MDEELQNAIERFAQAELRRVDMAYDSLSLIRNKDGVSVWRIFTGTGSYVMKCFNKVEYRREIENYQILISLGVPTLHVFAHTEGSLVIEDIEQSAYRLATIEDINDPEIAGKIALWYRALHESGRKYLNTHCFIDEWDNLTLENMRFLQGETETFGLRVWRVIEENFERIHSMVMRLPRTLVYTDFHYSNLAVARDGSSVLIFDYNFLFKSYAYSDVRNVCGNFYNAEAKAAFLSAYGFYDTREVIIDDVVSVLSALLVACGRRVFPSWANGLLEKVRDGRLLAAVERLLKEKWI